MIPKAAIAHYRLTSKLGEGGMGAVYRATDTKLNREVAVKVLPDSLAGDRDRMARFEREAQLLAALNHPNIAAVYGVEDGAIVMELVEGETLAGPLPVATALDYARQIALALEAAHEKGIIHRDLKPANIKVTSDGQVKVLDFGLAKVAEAPAGAATASPTISPTLSIGMTQAGMILGTAAYMAPEQARGKAADKRADIWAFGVVLYEMLTGAPLYGGETVTDTLAAVVLREPDWSALPVETPARIRRLIELCLKKDPKQRLRDIGDARILIDDAEPGAAGPVMKARSPLPWILAGLLALIATGAGAAWWRASRPQPRAAIRLDVNFGPQAIEGQRSTTLISPDGRRIVFTGRVPDGRVGLYTRMLDEPAATLLPGTETPDWSGEAAFSPDGEWIAYYSGEQVKKVAVHGGAPIALCTAQWLGGINWGEDGTIVYAAGNRLFRIPASGGEARQISDPAKDGSLIHSGPQILPGAKYVLFTAIQNIYDSSAGEIRALSLETGATRVVYRGAGFARYLPSGHLALLRNSTLYAVRFDIDKLQALGNPVPILYDIAPDRAAGFGMFEFSSSGTLVYVPGQTTVLKWPVAWMRADGTTTPILPPAMYYAPALSPDGKRLAYSVRADKSMDLWVYDLARETPAQLTFNAVRPNGPEVAWGPDGRHIAYGTQTKEGPAILWIRSDGSGQPQVLLPGPGRPHSFSPDGRTLVFSTADTGIPDLWTVKLDLTDPEHPKAGSPEPYLVTPAVDVDGAISPDGLWMAYASSESGQEEVFVRSFRANSGGGGKFRISTAGGKFPVWSHGGRELFFLGGDDRIMVTSYTATGANFEFGKPRAWSPMPVRRTAVIRSFDVEPEGKRALVFPRAEKDVPDQQAVHATFVLNFFDELRRRVQ